MLLSGMPKSKLARVTGKCRDTGPGKFQAMIDEMHEFRKNIGNFD